MTSPPDLLSISEAAAAVPCSYQTVWSAVIAGRLDATRVDGKWRIKRGAVDRFRVVLNARRAVLGVAVHAGGLP